MAATESNAVSIHLLNQQGAKIGVAMLSQMKDGVQIQVQAANLSPGEHGFHIHNVGLCEVPDFKSAGDHLNPMNKQHGFKNPLGYHAGDLPNLVVKADGTVNATVTDKMVTLEKGKPNSLLTAQGTSLIIHQKADDYMTDPSGNSGDRIACAVIK